MAYKYLKNKVTKPTTYYLTKSSALGPDIRAIPDLKSLDVQNLKNLLKSYPSNYYLYIKVKTNTNLEKLSYDIYGTPDYYDTFYLINDIDPLLDVPYDYDTVVNLANKMVDEYEKKHNATLTDKDRERLYQKYESKLLDENVIHGEIAYIKPEYINEVLARAYELGLITSNISVQY